MARPTRQRRVSFRYTPAQVLIPEIKLSSPTKTSNENGEHSLGRATEKESRACYYSTSITAGTNTVHELTLGSTIRESPVSL